MDPELGKQGKVVEEKDQPKNMEQKHTGNEAADIPKKEHYVVSTEAVEGLLKTAVHDYVPGKQREAAVELQGILENATREDSETEIDGGDDPSVPDADELLYAILKKRITRFSYSSDLKNYGHTCTKFREIVRSKMFWIVAMLFSLSTNTNAHFDIQPSVHNQPLNVVQCVKYLGIWLDPKLSWSVHSQKAATKSRQAIGAFSRHCRNFVPNTVFCHLYKQVILPSFLYGLTIAYPINVNDCGRLERVHEYAARTVSNCFELSYEDLLLQLKWKPISRIVKEKRLILLHNYHHGVRFLPDGILNPQRDFVGRNTRAHGQIQNDFSYDRSFPSRNRCGRGYFMDSIGLWNVLSNDQIALNRENFKRFVRRRDF